MKPTKKPSSSDSSFFRVPREFIPILQKHFEKMNLTVMTKQDYEEKVRKQTQQAISLSCSIEQQEKLAVVASEKSKRVNGLNNYDYDERKKFFSKMGKKLQRLTRDQLSLMETEIIPKKYIGSNHGKATKTINHKAMTPEELNKLSMYVEKCCDGNDRSLKKKDNDDFSSDSDVEVKIELILK